jgi:hypothetical protein
MNDPMIEWGPAHLRDDTTDGLPAIEVDRPDDN